MGPITQFLLRLQEIETKLWTLRESVAVKTRALTAYQRKIKQIQDQLDQKTDQLKHMQAQADSQDLDIKTQEAQLGKLRNALNTAKTNKEYDSILSQINSDRTEMSRLEEKYLALLSQIDQTKSECQQVRQELTNSQAHLEIIRQDQEKTQAGIEGQLSELQTARDQVAELLPPEALRIFERVGRNYEAQALVAVTQNGPRQASYSCSGCHMGITVDTVNLLMSKDEIRQCPSCQRMLYFLPENEH